MKHGLGGEGASQCRVEVSMPYGLVAEHCYEGRAIDIGGVATARPVTGTLELFPAAGDVAMRYRIRTSEDDGDALVLVGTKHQHRRNPLWLWSDLTTLDIESADTVGRLHISPLETLKLASSIRGDAFTRGKRAAAVARFLMFFTRSALRGMMRP